MTGSVPSHYLHHWDLSNHQKKKHFFDNRGNNFFRKKTTVYDCGHRGDVIKWKHFPCYCPFVRGIHRSPVNSPHKGQRREALVFSGDLRRRRTHFDVTVMYLLEPRPRVAMMPIFFCYWWHWRLSLWQSPVCHQWRQTWHNGNFSRDGDKFGIMTTLGFQWRHSWTICLAQLLCRFNGCCWQYESCCDLSMFQPKFVIKNGIFWPNGINGSAKCRLLNRHAIIAMRISANCLVVALAVLKLCHHP